jgi:integrase/recombinase XerC
MAVQRIISQELGAVDSISGKKSPHMLRHTLATELLDNGADLNSIKELLGHSSLAATQVYTHNSIEKLKQVYNRAHPRAKRGGNNGD